MLEGIHAADEAFSSNDVAAYATHFTEDFFHDNVNEEPASRDAFFAMVNGFLESFPGVRNYQKDLLPSGSFVVFDECTFDIPVSGIDNFISVYHMDIVEMDGDKLKVKTTFGDSASFPVAFGQIVPPVPVPRPATISVPSPVPTRLTPEEGQKEFQNRWNQHDLPAMARMIHGDAEILVSPLFEPVDKNLYVGWQQLVFGVFSDLNMETVRILHGDGWAASEALLTGTNTGSYDRLSPTGKPIELRAGYLTRFDDDGLIISLKFFIDSMVIMGQLGLDPTPVTRES